MTVNKVKKINHASGGVTMWNVNGRCDAQVERSKYDGMEAHNLKRRKLEGESEQMRCTSHSDQSFGIFRFGVVLAGVFW